MTGCSSNAVYTRENFSIHSQFQRRFLDKPATACEGARRVLLAQGYLIDSATAEDVKARKAYRSEDEQSTFIEMHIVCATEENGSTLYATALLSTYDVKKTGTNASVGVKAIGSVSLPFGQSADSMVKVSDETIDDRKFYKRFFAAVAQTLVEMQPKQTPQDAEVFPAH